MPTTRMRQWLLDHPEVLTLAFLIVLKLGEYDFETQGATGYAGP